MFCNDFTKKIIAGNMTTFIFDHLTQFLTIRDQTTSFEYNRKKKIPKLRKLDK